MLSYYLNKNGNNWTFSESFVQSSLLLSDAISLNKEKLSVSGVDYGKSLLIKQKSIKEQF